MTTITYVSPDGTRMAVDARDGESLMQTAIDHGIPGIVGECGGSMMCATCHVYVDDAFLDKLPPRSEGEEEMLECAAGEMRPTSRLSCQIKSGPEIDGLVVRLPDAQ